MLKRVRDVFLAVAVTGLAFLILGRVGWFECHYYNNATVTCIDSNNNIIVVIDDNNNEWTFLGDGYFINDRVRLTMYTNHTDLNIFDDEIEDVRVLE